MTVVLDRRLTAPLSCGVGRGGPEIDETDDVVVKYLERWVDADGRTSLPANDPCSIGLLKAMDSRKEAGL
jgi:hypothetical protein